MRTTAFLAAMLLSVAAVAPGAAKAATDETVAVDDRPRVDIDFEDGDLRMVVRILCAAGSFKAEVAPEVNGKITIRVHDKPWDEALDLIARDANLVYQRQGKTIHVRRSP